MLDEVFKTIVHKMVETHQKQWPLDNAQKKDWYETMSRRLRNMLHDAHAAAFKKTKVPDWMVDFEWVPQAAAEVPDLQNVADDIVWRWSSS